MMYDGPVVEVCNNDWHEEYGSVPCILSGTIMCAGCDDPDCPSTTCDNARESTYQKQVERGQE